MNKTCPNGHRMRELQSVCKACGWQEDAGASKGNRHAGEIPLWPKQCMVDGCMNKTEVVSVEARKPGGDIIRTNGGLAVYRNGENFTARKGWDFIGWITRCADHYLHELDVRKLSRIEPVEKLVETVRTSREQQARAQQEEKIRSREQEAALLRAARESYKPVGSEAAA
jgi:hypothetical protein